MNRQLFQVIDANLNRTREGLRVCEDIARFIMADKNIAKSLKLIRHTATMVLFRSKKVPLKKVVQARDTKKDALKFTDFKKGRGTDAVDIFMANIERVKESLRVLEECCKIVDIGLSRKYRALRFNTYDVEKKVVENSGNISGNR